MKRYTVYIFIEGQYNKSYYVGMTTNLFQRMKSHIYQANSRGIHWEWKAIKMNLSKIEAKKLENSEIAKLLIKRFSVRNKRLNVVA